jgi:hypothetical protein
MKTLFTLVICASFTAAFAQTTKPAAAPTPAPTTQTTPALSTKQKSVAKEWKFVRSESFDLSQPPTEAQKNDLVFLMENGRYRLILDGVAEGGTWSVDAGCKWITMTTEAGAVKKFQILSQTETELKVDYRDGDGTHNVLIYSSVVTAPGSGAR